MAQKRRIDMEESSGIVETWSRTEQYKVRGRHYWTIVDFMRRAALTELGNSLCSPIFFVPVEGRDGEQNLTFQLEVFPNGEEGEDNRDYVAVFLTSRKMEELDVKYDFSVQKADGTPWGKIGNTFKKFSPDQNSWGYGKAFSKAKLAEKMNELMPSGKLTIICNLEIYYYDRHTTGKKPCVLFKVDDTPTLGENIFTALGNPSWADISLTCGGCSFQCHKVILASRSDVFAAMFSHSNTEEVQTSIVKIEDMEPKILKALLEFVYSDKVEDLRTVSLPLFTAADKYNIPRLKKLCEKFIAESLCVNTAVDALILAHLHEAEKLKSLALEFVIHNMNEVSEMPSWQIMTESHPKLMSELLIHVTTKKFNS